MESIEKAYAKINISLDVVSKLENGYHEMLMIMQSVSLHDIIKIHVEKGQGKIKVSTNRPYLPTDSRNIAYKAASLFLDETGIKGYDISLNVVKTIPVCAGLGGGSTDGAAVLRGLDRLFSCGLKRAQLEEMAAGLGSDVPFCVAGGTALATGTGTQLEDMEPMPDCSIVICKPSFSVSTPELFSKIDCAKIRCRPDTKGIMEAYKDGNLKEIGKRVFNVFEDVLPSGRDKVDEIKGMMYDCHALGASMTGTGSAVYGIFEGREEAKDAYGRLKAEYGETFLSRPIKKLEL